MKEWCFECGLWCESALRNFPTVRGQAAFLMKRITSGSFDCLIAGRLKTTLEIKTSWLREAGKKDIK